MYHVGLHIYCKMIHGPYSIRLRIILFHSNRPWLQQAFQSFWKLYKTVIEDVPRVWELAWDSVRIIHTFSQEMSSFWELKSVFYFFTIGIDRLYLKSSKIIQRDVAVPFIRNLPSEQTRSRSVSVTSFTPASVACSTLLRLHRADYIGS